VVPFDRGDRCGENGPNLNVARQVWSEIRAMEMIVKNIEKNQNKTCDSEIGSGSGGVAVVPFDRLDRCGSDGANLNP
jgi:hypothetical protein